jgi:phospholipase C
MAGRDRTLASPSIADRPREPDSLPNPSRPPGTVDESLPFEHIVVVMMENHSFDNLLGAAALRGQPAAEGLTFDASGRAQNSNPGADGPVRSFPFPTTAQGGAVTQTWNATHEQIDGGRMDGFVRSIHSSQPMGYWDEDRLPFAYSLAKTFTLANRWFSSVPCQTLPNRRFLMAGTAAGATASSLEDLMMPPPPNGTIFDRLGAHEISWRDYFTDVPQLAIMPAELEAHLGNLAPIEDFYSDCASGHLPAVSFVDPGMGVLSEIGKLLRDVPLLRDIAPQLEGEGSSEEAPQDLSHGEQWAHGVVEALLRSPAWPRTLLVYTYDEHGGYYDHVAPPPAIPPDAIPPRLSPGDAPGGYDIYGVRVPAVVASPYCKPAAVTDVVHDHTSVLATIEAKWNLPALTFRDANAATLLDCLDPGEPSLLTPPALAAP